MSRICIVNLHVGSRFHLCAEGGDAVFWNLTQPAEISKLVWCKVVRTRVVVNFGNALGE